MIYFLSPADTFLSSLSLFSLPLSIYLLSSKSLSSPFSLFPLLPSLHSITSHCLLFFSFLPLSLSPQSLPSLFPLFYHSFLFFLSSYTHFCSLSLLTLSLCSDIPNNLHRDSTPQLVMITFDDAVTRDSYNLYRQLISGIVNPNGCPISGTFFVSHEFTDYWTIQQLHAQGHEIASHSITHRYPPTWWKTANYTDWYSEIQGQREMLSTWANVDKSEIRGMRAPFLQAGGNWQFQVIADMKKDGFQYDSSLVSYIHKFDPYPDPIWPYTLDYPTTDDCGIDPCPDWTFRGIWESTIWLVHARTLVEKAVKFQGCEKVPPGRLFTGKCLVCFGITSPGMDETADRDPKTGHFRAVQLLDQTEFLGLLR
ncbi:unnamed protein product [Acanthosepion pharaonis]|uniref:NodB homology domain-containing protein n=1 Tax=Acanthosepion pharaonis TaxID=158019 RepID=A0A812DWT1_ACAPH|nr:unnamed protein product [Sepia pharaonis]